jgi:hypothetical protein
LVEMNASMPSFRGELRSLVCKPTRRRWQLAGLILAHGLGMSILSNGIWADEAKPNRHNQLEISLGDSATVPNGLGVNIHYIRGHEGDLDKLQASGIRLVRMDLLWQNVEKYRGAYDWAPYDELVGNLRRRGLTPLIVLLYSNDLYAQRLSNTGRPEFFTAPPRDVSSRAAFVAYAQQAVLHFGGKVIWEIWNEPNLNFGHPVDLDSYISLATATCRAIQSADKKDALVIGPAASRFPWTFLEKFIQADGGRCFSGISVHPYRDTEPPESILPDWIAFHNRLSSAERAPIIPVNSEWGYHVGRGGVTEEIQASFLLRGYLLDMMARVPITILYDFQNDGPDPNDGESNFGLVDFKGKPKAAYVAIRDFISKARGLRYVGFIPSRKDDYVLVFADVRGMAAAIVGWTTAEHRSMEISDREAVCTTLALEQDQTLSCPMEARLSTSMSHQTIYLDERPQVFTLDGPHAVSKPRVNERKGGSDWPEH